MEDKLNVTENKQETFEITILGRRYKITTDQGAAYVQKAVDYVGQMHEKMMSTPGFTRHSKDFQNLMMYLNMADDYLRASQWSEDKQLLANQEAEAQIQALEEEIAEVKQRAMETEQRLQDEMVHLKKRVEYSFHEKNHMVEQVKSFEQKNMVLEKELTGYKTETSVLKRKMDEMVRNAEEISKLRKEASVRSREWETRMQQLKQELEEKHAAELEATEVVHTKAMERVNRLKDDSLQTLREEYEKRIIRMQKQYETELASMKTSYESQLDTLKTEHAMQLDSLKSDQEKKLGRLVNDHENQIGRMKTAHEAKIERLMAGQNDIAGPLQATIDSQAEELIELKDKLADAENKLASLRYKLQEAVGE